MSFPNPINILNQGKSYFGQFASYVRNPTKLLKNTSLGFLANTTLSKMEGRGDPMLNIFWTVAMPQVPLYTVCNEKLLNKASELISSAADWGKDYLSKNQLNSGGAFLANIVGPAALSSVQNTAAQAVNQSQKISIGDEFIESITLVNKEYNSREVFRAGALYKYPDTSFTIPDLTINFFGDKDLKSFRYVQNWIELINQPLTDSVPHGAWAVPKIYKKVITVGVADENANEFYLVDYQGCWPKSVNEIELSSDGDDYIVYSTTFSVDNLKVYGYNLQTFTESIMNYAGAVTGNVVGNMVNDFDRITQNITSDVTQGII